MNRLSPIVAILLVAWCAVEARATRGCPNGRGATSAATLTAGVPILSTTGMLAVPAYERSYSYQLANRQAYQQAYLAQQAYWQQQYSQREEQLASQRDEARQHKIAVRQAAPPGRSGPARCRQSQAIGCAGGGAIADRQKLMLRRAPLQI